MILISFFIFGLRLFLDPAILGVSTTSPWWSYLTFNFAHANFLHLLLNSIAVYQYQRAIQVNKLFKYATILIVPAISAYLSLNDTPTIGLSAIAFSLTGIYLASVKIDRSQWIRFLIMTSIAFVVTGFLQVNTLIHFYSLVISFCVTYLWGKQKKSIE